jgi:preprotein translocase subunit YajC
MTNILLQAQQQGGGGMMMLLMMVAIFAIMYFFMIRPQQKQQKEIRNFQNQLAEGMSVVVGSGIYGTVKSVDLSRNTVDVKIAKDVVITVAKTAVFRDMSNIPAQK